MNQKICVGNTGCFYFNDKIKEYIFVIICQIHNINQEKSRTLYSYCCFLTPFDIYFVGVYVSILSIFHKFIIHGG